MLYALGSLLFEIWPVNVTDAGRSTDAGIVDKPVMGRRPPLEMVGDGPETRTFTIKLFPEKLGGLSSTDTLDAMRQAGVPLSLMRGDGVPLGWFLVDKTTEKHSHLNAQGVGREIDMELTLKRADAPAAVDAIGTIIELFQ
jgi:phage protein U